REDQERLVHDQAAIDSETDAYHAAEDQTAATGTHARRRYRRGPLAGFRGSRVVQLPCDPWKLPEPERFSHGGPTPLATRPQETKSEGTQMDLGACPSLDAQMASQPTNPTSLS